MDLYPKQRAARNSVCRVLISMVALLLLWLPPIHADYSNAGRDYLLPGKARGGFIATPSSIESKSSFAKIQSSTSYQAFDGSTHQLVENRGRFVNVLIPQFYDEGVFFTADHMEELVDRLDMLYVIYTELMHKEPAGNGLLNIAFIPQTCGMGCGLIGARGFEILSHPRNYEAIIHELDAGRLEPVLLHEMAHNFDTHSAYLHYLPDHAHAWTDMFEFFAPFRYARISSNEESPDDRYNSPVSAVWKGYIDEQSANWQSCVMDDACGDLGLSANSLWAMLYYRVETLHGVEAILDSFKFLKNYADTHAPPSTQEEKESVRILSLAMGAGVNIACYVDALKWPVQSGTRSELEMIFGNSNELCADQDGDGFSTIAGDCDDGNTQRNMATPEVNGNGMDDDCDDLVDETHLVETQAGPSADNFVDPVQTALPFEVQGSTASTDDRDRFIFTVPASGRVRTTLCSQGSFRGWMTALNANGSFLQAYNYYSYQSSPGCTSNTFDFGKSVNAGFVVIPDESMGEYSLVATAAEELLADHSGLVQIIADPSGGVELQIMDQNGLFGSLGADEIEIWISGAGVQLFKPFTPELTVKLNSNTIPALQDGETYQLRVRPRAKGLPLASFSAGHLFRYDQAPASLPEVDHRFSGAWFDAEHDGEGFIIEVLENDRATISWFTYRDDGTQRWFLGIGEVNGNIITVADLLETHGGRFGENFNPDDVIFESVGTLSLSFLDCSTALANYSVNNNGDHQSISRISNVYGHSCGEQTPVPLEDISGSWYDPSHNGEGYLVQQISEDEALVVWFTYDDLGNQSWLFSTGSIDNGRIDIPHLMQPQGGHFGRSFEPTEVIHHEWGELTLDLDCFGGIANYSTQTAGFSSGSQSLVPGTRLGDSGCSH